MSRVPFSLPQLAYAIWNLVAVASRTVTVATNSDKTGYDVTKFGGANGTFSTGRAHAIAHTAGIHGTVAFGSGETEHTASLAGLGAVAIGEIELAFTGPYLTFDSTGATWAVCCQVTSTTVVTFYRIPLSPAASDVNLGVSTHIFNARRVVLP